MSTFSQRIRELAQRVLREHASPARLGVAVAIGTLVGSSPLIGLHAIVALGLASLARLNRVGAFVGSNISLGPLLPLWAAAEISLGVSLRGRGALAVDGLHWSTAFTAAAGSWWLGWLFVGPILAGITGGLTFVLARRRARGASPTSPRPSQAARPTPVPPANE
jgi:uncharacterized protein (DUF2062 family)